MTIIKSLTLTTALAVLLSSSAAYARYEKEDCQIPKIRSFMLEKHEKGQPVPEVAAEGQVGFYVSHDADPTTIRAVAKKKYQLKT